MKKIVSMFHLFFIWKNRKQLGKAVKYLVHMPGVDGPIWRVRLVVSRVATFHQILLINSKRRRGRRGQADWLLELWGAPLRHVRRGCCAIRWIFDSSSIHEFVTDCEQALWSLAFWNWRHLPFTTACWCQFEAVIIPWFQSWQDSTLKTEVFLQ